MYYETEVTKSFVKSKVVFSLLLCVGHCAFHSYSSLPTQPLHIFLSLFSINTAYIMIVLLIKWYQLLDCKSKGDTVSLWVALSRLKGKSCRLYSHFKTVTQEIPLWVQYFLNILVSECVTCRKLWFQNIYGYLCFSEMWGAVCQV